MTSPIFLTLDGLGFPVRLTRVRAGVEHEVEASVDLEPAAQEVARLPAHARNEYAMVVHTTAPLVAGDVLRWTADGIARAWRVHHVEPAARVGYCKATCGGLFDGETVEP
jgi:hypothetical protein